MGATSARVDRFYGILRLIARFWIWFFFRDVTVRGAEGVPSAGPVLLCVNHPNNLIDSLLVGAVLPRKVHYLATATLFRRPPLVRFLTRAGAIPVYRRQDDPSQADRNRETFAACRRALEAGGVLAIYPEGTTHADAKVLRIRTGAARIALDYEVARRDTRRPPLTLVAVGLSFAARKAFRGGVRVAFGPPLPLAEHAARARQDPGAAVEGLTDAIQAAMEAELVHVDRVGAAEVVRAVEALYRDELVRQLRAERGLAPEAVDAFRLSRAIVEAVAHFSVHDPDRVARLWRQIRRYRALLARCHVRDQAVRARLAVPDPPRRLRESWLAILGLPVFAYGALGNALPYLLPRWLSRRVARKETDYATVRLLSSIVAFPLFWGAETWLAWRAAGPLAAAIFAASLPLSGLIAYHYVAGIRRLEARTRFALLALTRRRTASRLLVERRRLLAELERAKTDFLAARRPGNRASSVGVGAVADPETER
jgi:glycerol-3-phosphate O-acyltransferase/dihydroxyacetone phosphate acyltransferase